MDAHVTGFTLDLLADAAPPKLDCYTQIPLSRPATPLLDQIERPEQLRALDPSLLPQLAQEVRVFMMYAVGKTGGHFGAGLGVVELTLALHYVFNTPGNYSPITI